MCLFKKMRYMNVYVIGAGSLSDMHMQDFFKLFFVRQLVFVSTEIHYTVIF